VANLGKFFIFIGTDAQPSQSLDCLCALMAWDRSLFPYRLSNRYDIEAGAFSESDRLLTDDLIQFQRRFYEAALAIN